MRKGAKENYMTNPAIHALIGHAENLAHLLRAELVASNVGAADAALTFHTLAEAEVAHLVKVLSAVVGVRAQEEPEALEDAPVETVRQPSHSTLRVFPIHVFKMSGGLYELRPKGGKSIQSARVVVERQGDQWSLWSAKADWNPVLHSAFRTKSQAVEQAREWLEDYVKESI
jgi:hypothetical protein